MQNLCTVLAVALLTTALSGCADEPDVQQELPPAAPITDPSKFISASDVLDRLRSGANQWIFDVRSKPSFDELHIQSAVSLPYGHFDQSDLAAIEGLDLDSDIVTYCGCPHTLASFAANQLLEYGYKNARVLHEGFFYWRDNGLPVMGQNAQRTTRLEFAGTLKAEETPLAHRAVFIRNTRNGQLEAATTNANGYFETEFHVMSFREDDIFQVHVASLDSPELAKMTATRGRKNVVQLH